MKQILLMIVAVVMVGCGGGLDGYYKDTNLIGLKSGRLDIELASDGAASMYTFRRGKPMETTEGEYSVSGDEVSITWDESESAEIFTLNSTKRFLSRDYRGMTVWRGEKR